MVTKDIEQRGASFATQHLWGKGCILGCNHLILLTAVTITHSLLSLVTTPVRTLTATEDRDWALEVAAFHPNNKPEWQVGERVYHSVLINYSAMKNRYLFPT